MTAKKVKLRPWTKDDVKTLKTLAREGTKTTAIARKLKRSVGATHQKAMARSITRGALGAFAASAEGKNLPPQDLQGQ